MSNYFDHLLSIGTLCRELCKNAAEPIEMTFGMLSRVDARNHVLNVGADAPTARALLGSIWPIAKHRISGHWVKG